MKKIILITTVIILSLLLSQSCVGIVGSGNKIKETRPVENFDAISVGSGIKVIYTQGQNIEIIVEADDNIVPRIKTQIKDDVLSIGYTAGDNIRNSSSPIIYITAPNLEEIDVSSAAVFSCKTPCVFDELEIDMSSASKLFFESECKVKNLDIEMSSASKAELNIKAEICEINLSSASKCTLTGSTNELKVDASSASSLKGNNFTYSISKGLNTSSAASIKLN